MNRLYLVRHGENPANLTKEFSSLRVDYPLTPKGVLQAKQTAQYFTGLPIDAIFASPLKRARQTAEIIGQALNLPVTVLDEFREVNVGDLELAPPTREAWDFHNSIIEAWMAGDFQARFPGGENFLELVERALRGYAKAVAGRTGENIIIVAHGGIFTSTLKRICPEVDIQRLARQENHNCSITEILLGEADDLLRGELVSWASCAHLSGEAAQLVSGMPDEASIFDREGTKE